jgi:hypothetical protein
VFDSWKACVSGCGTQSADNSLQSFRRPWRQLECIAFLHDHAAEPGCLPWSLGDDGKKKSASLVSLEATLVIGRHFHRSFRPVACEPVADSVTFSLPGSHCWSAYDAALSTRKFSSSCVSISLFAKILNVASYHGRSTEAVSKSMSLGWPRTLD